ncbi:MAG: efflux RND transporter periplasmic adaptor subunit [Bacteroidia bacterium]|nr:efflux RND transporter periplasmic adaptor subunit [Bacteroidia bacterium]MCO5254434.1 efflux RND transporter periplasmic adaptor subunit [Bacteroidota bacterium]
MRIIYIAAISTGILFASCSNKNNNQQTKGAQTPTLPVIQIPSKSITGLSSYPVSLEGIVNAEVRAKIAGYVTAVLVDEGQYVSQGQPLFRLETDALTEDAEAAKANVEAAQVGVDQLRPLVEQKIVSPIQLQTAEAKLAQAKAAYKSITANIGYANISSPVAGYVGRITYRQGSLVNPSNPLPLTIVSNTNEIFAYFAMNEANYLDFLQKSEGATLQEKIKHFPKVQLKMANGEIYEHEGTIQTVTAQVDPGTGSVNFRAVFPNPAHLLANGSSGTILIPKTYTNAVLVPEEATFEMQGKVYIFIVKDDNKVEQHVIEVQERIGNILVVKSGVKAGDKIVGQGASKLQNGTLINPVAKSFEALIEELKPAFK